MTSHRVCGSKLSTSVIVTYKNDEFTHFDHRISYHLDIYSVYYDEKISIFLFITNTVDLEHFT